MIDIELSAGAQARPTCKPGEYLWDTQCGSVYLVVEGAHIEGERDWIPLLKLTGCSVLVVARHRKRYITDFMRVVTQLEPLKLTR